MDVKDTSVEAGDNDAVGRVEQFPDARGEREERDEPVPRVLPDLDGPGVFMTELAGAKLGQRLECGIGIRRRIYFPEVNIHVPGARDWLAGAVAQLGGVQGGSGMGGIQGLPARASQMAVRTQAPCLATVEM